MSPSILWAMRVPLLHLGHTTCTLQAAMAACKVQVVCPKCNKGTRVAHKIEGGKKTRVCKHCGAEL